MYEPRTYRYLWAKRDLTNFQVIIQETDIKIGIDKASVKDRSLPFFQDTSRKWIKKYRQDLEEYILRDPEFQTTFKFHPISRKNSPEIVRVMARAVQPRRIRVGPMAAVAGTIAELLGRGLLKYCKEVIVENGGDIFIKTNRQRRIGIFAGRSSPFNKLSLEIYPAETPLGICTSSGTIGHSISFGKADAVTVLSASTPLADAGATKIGNLIHIPADIPKGLNFARKVKGLKGVIIIKGGRLGVWGDLHLVGCK